MSKFVTLNQYAKVKYSDIESRETSSNEGHWALHFLLKNGYVEMNAYFEKEIKKVIDCLKTLGLRVKIVQNNYAPNVAIASNEVGKYEFMLDFFEDDRK